MNGVLQFAAGLALVVAAWLIPRRTAGARLSSGAAVALDFAPVVVTATLLAVITGRPLFGGLVVFALGVGFAVADRATRDTLHEPVVFQAMSELPQVFTHPQLYLPFAGPGVVIGGALGAGLAGLVILIFVPSAWTPRPLAGLAAALAIGIAWWRLGCPPLLARVADGFRRLDVSGDPTKDAERLGPFAMLLTHCAIARAERPARRQALAPKAAAPSLDRTRRGPIVVIQCESFFDARRLSPLVPAEFMSGFAECCRSAAMYGGLVVPGWGANTMRAEFAVLTGIPEAALGLDRFNPYYQLARVPLASHVRRLREAGYRTICLHPFDRRFFRRDLVMPALGFDRFLGHEELGTTKAPPYQTDPDLAGQVLRVLDKEGPNSFVFVITMGNHGPYLDRDRPLDAAVAAFVDPARVPQGAELSRYLDGLRRSDEMLRMLMAGLAARHPDAILALYGDHLPSLPRAFAHFGFAELHSDYVIWPGAGAAPYRVDMPAHRLGGAVVEMAIGGGREAAKVRAAQ